MLEVVDSRVDGGVQIVDVRATVNQKAEPIDMAIAKMQSAQVQFVQLLIDSFGRLSAPVDALHPLEALKTSHKMRQVCCAALLARTHCIVLVRLAVLACRAP